MSTETSQMKPTLVITSGEGHIASSVVSYLKEKAPNHFKEIRLICKDKDAIGELAESCRGLPIRVCNLNETSLASALDGGDLALLIQPAHGDPIKATQDLVNAAQQVGLPGAVLVSWTHSVVNGIDKTKILKQFRTLENQFMDSRGIQTKTLVYVSLFIEIIKYFAEPLLHDGILPLPVKESAKVAPIDAKQVGVALGAMAAAWTTSHVMFHNQTLSLTGPTLMSPTDLVYEINRAGLGGESKIRFVPISMEKAREVVAQSSVCVHPAEIDAVLDGCKLWDEGHLEFISLDLVQIIGIDPEPWAASLHRIVSHLPKITSKKGETYQERNPYEVLSS